MKQIIGTHKAPRAMGAYSQAIKAGNTVYLSGQIPLIPETMQMVQGDFKVCARQVFNNLAAVSEAAGGSLADVVRLTIYLTDMGNFSDANEIMKEFCQEPYPARTTVVVKQLPKEASIEIDAVIVLGE